MATIPTNFLFRFRFSCKHWGKTSPRSIKPETLDSSYSVPVWSQLTPRNAWGGRVNEPDEAIGVNAQNQSLFDFRIGWSRQGLVWTAIVAGKERQPFWNRSYLHDADVVKLCVDTRDLRELRRGNRFCHKFAFYPFVGEAEDVVKPLVQWLPLHRAQETPSSVDVDAFVMKAERRRDGYAFSAFIPSTSLNGFEPESFDRFGAHFAVSDSAHGAFTLQHGSPLPYEDDPSLWSSFVMKSDAS